MAQPTMGADHKESMDALLAHMTAMGWNTDRPLRWIYRFDAFERAPLEGLIPKLRALGYSGIGIDASLGQDCFSLTFELVAQATSERLFPDQKDFEGMLQPDGLGQPWFHSCRIEAADVAI